MRELLRISHGMQDDRKNDMLRDYELEVFAGDIIYIQGLEGSGIGTLLQVLSGACALKQGQLYLSEQLVSAYTKDVAFRYKIHTITAEQDLVETMTVAENLEVLRRISNPFRQYNRKKIEQRVAGYLAHEQAAIRADAYLWELSRKDRLILSILKAKMHGARVIVLDLTENIYEGREAEELCTVIRRANQEGITFLILSQCYMVFAEIANRIQIIYRGRELKEWYHHPELARDYLKQQKITRRDSQVNRLEPRSFLGLFDYDWEMDRSIWSYLSCLKNWNREIWDTHIQAAIPDEGVGMYGLTAVIPSDSAEQLLDQLSIEDNLILPLSDRVSRCRAGMIRKRISRHLADEFYRKLRIAPTVRYPDELSRVQRKILSIYRFELKHPGWIILESPYSGMSREEAGQLRSYLSHLSQKESVSSVFQNLWTTCSQTAPASSQPEMEEVQNSPPFDRIFHLIACIVSVIIKSSKNEQHPGGKSMKEELISITNETMELADCRNAWQFDERYHCWCLEDLLYTTKATKPKFQRMSIFAPEEYMNPDGTVNENGQKNGYTAKTAPVVFANNSAGYMQMPHVWLDGPRCRAQEMTEAGFVYVSCGNRGHESKDKNGNYCGKSPANLIDLKTGIRFLRHNRSVLPGNYDCLISVGTSAGGAMSTLLAVTGNHPEYIPYLEENGAFLNESDAVFASQIYCPIIDLEHADLAYEWMFSADHENEASHAGSAGVMTPFEEALSGLLKEKYIDYFNSLSLKDPTDGSAILLGADGRSGSGYAYLMQKLESAAAVYLKKLENRELSVSYTPQDYLEGNYTYLAPAPPQKDEHGKDREEDLLRSHAGPGVALLKKEEASQEPPSLGDLVSRPPKGVPFQEVEPPMQEQKGTDNRTWLSWDGTHATIRDLDTYLLHHRRRMKPCTSFDVLRGNSGENKVFGSKTENALHFSSAVAQAIGELRDAFPEEYDRYYKSYAKIYGDEELAKRIHLINPMDYIAAGQNGDCARHCRIRVGSCDADTSFTISMTLALKLAELGIDTDYQLVWDQPHCEADYPGDMVQWIERICKK
jgi:ABC-type sugar transport system ATPase subunit/acetyl esterase/lipase